MRRNCATFYRFDSPAEGNERVNNDQRDWATKNRFDTITRVRVWHVLGDISVEVEHVARRLNN